MHGGKQWWQDKVSGRDSWPDATIWRFRWDEDDLSSLIAKVRRRTTLPALKDYEWPSSETLYVKPTHNTSQQNFLRLDPEDYERKLKRAWTTEARRLGDADEVVVEVFAYLTDAQARPGRQNQIKRSSKHGIEEGHRLIESAIEQGHLPKLGSMSTAYLARHLAKKVQPTTPDQIELPRSATYRQLQHLDSESEAFNQRTSEQHRGQQNDHITLNCTINFKKSQLRKALCLPDINLDGIVNFDTGVLSGPEIDMRDFDHEDDD
ncbi:MAG: hypothetical protein JOS17DRAFT_837745 [Linnemannia elongata]|nr:MAG: hypothetical protein JOS17DRAFT_837745 [Linnemannia elongata]